MKRIAVRVHESINLEQSQKILATVLGKAGCPNCYSGFNISFENVVDPADAIMIVEKGSHKITEVH